MSFIYAKFSIRDSMNAIYVFLVLLISSNAFANQENYTVKIDHKNHTLQVETCFKKAPRYLYTISNNAGKLIENITWNNNNIQRNKGYIYLPKGNKGCVSYSVNNNKNKGRLNNKSINQQHPNDTLLEISDWLWISANHGKSSVSQITFIHETGVNVSTPWQLVSRTHKKTIYQMKYTPDSWVGYTGFGVFDVIELNILNSTIQLAIINGTNHYNRANIMDWINQMTQAVAKISNGFPVKQLQVMVFLQKGSSGPVPWGQVNRYGGSGVFFVVNPDSPQDELISDWTAAHEFSHLLLPYTPYDRWLSEGFASYHQNISRARTGLLDEVSTWEKLLAGFKRGQRTANQYNAPVLKNAKGRNRMQMYWGGAVIALKADAALQAQTKGQMTLSRALAQLSRCCLETSDEWSAAETFLRLDEITNTQVFTNLYNQEVKYKTYPSYQKLLEELGINEHENGHIILDDNAVKAHIRKRIIKG
ncbi:MAG: hypothetical protein AB8B80_15040 [Marinicellaceae bacterium]